MASSDEAFGNMTAIEAISEKLSEVTSLAEQLDTALCDDKTSGSSVAPNITRILDGTASTTPEDWYSSLKSSSKSTSGDDSKSDDEFVTASECTCTPPSRASFHTASEGGTASPWWEASDVDDEARHRLKAASKATTETIRDIVVQQVVETTRMTLSHTPAYFPAVSHTHSATVCDDDDLLQQLIEVQPCSDQQDACNKYYYHNITRHALKTIL